MVESIARLETMRDMFLYAQQIYSWCLGRDFSLIYSNCPSQQFFYNMFEISFCSAAAEKHFARSRLPVILNDNMGFAWIAAAQMDDRDISVIHLLGPLFTVEASETYLQKLCGKMKLSPDLINELLRQLALVPTIPLNTAIRYGIMLHYSVTGTPVSASHISVAIEASESRDSLEDADWTSSSWHGTWLAEQELFARIKEGNLESMTEAAAKFASGHVGSMCPGNPLRQAKDEGIVFTVLASRAAIFGGVSPEGAYNLADYYIQRLEACVNVAEVQNCSGEMCETFVRRVHQCRQNFRYSPLTASCMEYIETHIKEKISLEEMARELGYTSYYLSGKFQKETGRSIGSHIKQQKIESAKQLLDNSSLTFADISEQLSFSSPSFFSSTFRKYTGMTPGEYQKRDKLE